LRDLNKQEHILGACCCFFFRQKIDEQKAEIERLERILDGKVEAEKKNIGNSTMQCKTITKTNLLNAPCDR